MSKLQQKNKTVARH